MDKMAMYRVLQINMVQHNITFTLTTDVYSLFSRTHVFVL